MTLLERLRVETRPAHDRIEHAVDIDGSTASIHRYCSLLERFYGFYAAWEPAAGPAIADAAFFLPRCKLGLLDRDLRALGLGTADIAKLPRCTSLVAMTSPAAAFGGMYVTEGSTLGGTVIARRIRDVLGLTETTGCAFFRSYGRATGAMWTAFRRKLQSLSSPSFDDVAVASAHRTFAAMQSWLCDDRMP
jgi:heme oxygenase